MIKIKRTYEKKSAEDGYRILIDRLWPRGVSKENAKVDLWLKEIAPSTALRKWFSHDPSKWMEFQRKYKLELKSSREFIHKIKQLEKEHGVVTLLYAAKDEEFNDAVVLRNILTD